MPFHLHLHVGAGNGLTVRIANRHANDPHPVLRYTCLRGGPPSGVRSVTTISRLRRYDRRQLADGNVRPIIQDGKASNVDDLTLEAHLQLKSGLAGAVFVQ